MASGRVHVFARARPTSAEDWRPCPTVADEATRTVKIYSEAELAQRLGRRRPSQGSCCSEGAGTDSEVSTAAGDTTRSFSCDEVFSGDSTQGEVFEKVGLPVLRECLKGFNGTILAYGQTGSGKTHSLLHQGADSDEAGLLPRLVACLFVHAAQDISNVYEIEAAAIQIYNEQVDDLLHVEHASGGGHNLTVQNGGSVPGLTWVKCGQPEVLLSSFMHARTNIVYAETKMNKASSRSHAVFQVKITKRARVTEAQDGSERGSIQRMECTHARLNVVDLAGSERVKKSGVEGMQLREASAINKSLLAFGNVVSALAAKRPFVPFRDSKLTRILDGSIGGNTKTSLLVCISPAADNVAETLSTLEFASRALRIEVDAKVNVGVVEVSANALLGDLKSGFDNLLCMSHKAELDNLRRESEEAEERSHGEVQRLAAAASAAECELSHLRPVAEASAQRAQELSTELETLRNATETNHTVLQEELDVARAKEAELVAEASAKRELVANLQASAAAAHEETLQLQARLEVAHDATARREQEVASLRGEVDSLGAVASLAETEISSLKLALEQMGALARDKAQEADAAISEVEQLKSQIFASKSALEQNDALAEEKAEESTLQLQQLRTELELTKAELERAQVALSTVLATAEERDASIVAVSEGRDAAHKEIEGLIAQRMELEEVANAEISRLKGQLEQQQAAFEDEEDAAAAQVGHLQSQVKRLSSEKSAEAEESTLQLQQLRTELEVTKAELERAGAALNTVVATAEERDASIVVVSEGRDAAHEEIQGLIAQRVRREEVANEEISRLKCQLEKLQAELQDEVEQLQSQVKSLSREKSEEAQGSTLQLQQLRTEIELAKGLIAQRVELEEVANEEICRLKGQLEDQQAAFEDEVEQLQKRGCDNAQQIEARLATSGEATARRAEEARSLREEVASLRAAAKRAEAQRALEAALSEASLRTTEDSQEAEKDTAQHQKLHKELEHANAELECARANLDAGVEAAEDMEAAFSQAKHEISRLKGELEEQQAAFEDEVEQLQLKGSENAQQIEALRLALAAAKKERRLAVSVEANCEKTHGASDDDGASGPSLQQGLTRATAARNDLQKQLKVMETRALEAERQARSATLQVIALEDTAAFRTAELDNFKRDSLVAQAKPPEDIVQRSVLEEAAASSGLQKGQAQAEQASKAAKRITELEEKLRTQEEAATTSEIQKGQAQAEQASKSAKRITGLEDKLKSQEKAATMSKQLKAEAYAEVEASQEREAKAAARITELQEKLQGLEKAILLSKKQTGTGEGSEALKASEAKLSATEAKLRASEEQAAMTKKKLTKSGSFFTEREEAVGTLTLDLTSARQQRDAAIQRAEEANTLMEDEVLKADARAQHAEAGSQSLKMELLSWQHEASRARRERDEAVQESQSAEARLEAEVELLQVKVEASAERESEFEAAERCRHSEALQAAKTEAVDWQEHALQCAKRMQTLEDDLRRLKGEEVDKSKSSRYSDIQEHTITKKTSTFSEELEVLRSMQGARGAPRAKKQGAPQGACKEPRGPFKHAKSSEVDKARSGSRRPVVHLAGA